LKKTLNKILGCTLAGLFFAESFIPKVLPIVHSEEIITRIPKTLIVERSIDDPYISEYIFEVSLNGVTTPYAVPKDQAFIDSPNLDQGKIGENSFGKRFNLLPNRTYTFRARVKDTRGLYSSYTPSLKYSTGKILLGDTTPPEVIISSLTRKSPGIYALLGILHDESNADVLLSGENLLEKEGVINEDQEGFNKEIRIERDGPYKLSLRACDVHKNCTLPITLEGFEDFHSPTLENIAYQYDSITHALKISGTSNDFSNQSLEVIISNKMDPNEKRVIGPFGFEKGKQTWDVNYLNFPEGCYEITINARDALENIGTTKLDIFPYSSKPKFTMNPPPKEILIINKNQIPIIPIRGTIEDKCGASVILSGANMETDINSEETNWTRNLLLTYGENKITAYAKNLAGLESEKFFFNIKVSTRKGDINMDEKVDLADLVIAQKVITGQNTKGLIREDYIQSETDVNGDGRVGLEEAIFIMQKISELK
jgi:hypothetical protein